MQLLFKRGQSRNLINRPIFTLWARVKFDNEEYELSKKHHFDDTVVIHVEQPGLIRASVFIGIAAFFVATFLLITFFGSSRGSNWLSILSLAAALGIGGGFAYFHQMRETIYLKDLIYGRSFKCASIVELARKEARLRYVTAYLRQVMEAAKTWGGDDVIDIPTLSGDEAIKLIQGSL